MELMQANRQWATRPADERFCSLHELAAFTAYEHANSKRPAPISNRKLTVVPSTSDPLDIAVEGPNGHPAQFTHWSFGQLCSLAGVPASYIRSSRMPGALAADNVNWGLHHVRDVESVSVLLRRKRQEDDTHTTFAYAFNGPDYGPVWNADIASTCVEEFGDGVTGAWRVPGEFGKRLDSVTKDNTTLYASDRDMWLFLADEDHRIEMPNRRNGQSGSFARGFFIGNSEVGSSALVLGMFLFDYVCCNRIIWGAQQFTEIRVRHTSGAPDRWLEEVRPVLQTMSRAPAAPIVETLKLAREQKIRGDVEKFLASRFGSKSLAQRIQSTHLVEEMRPVETIWDAVTGATALARQFEHIDARVSLERDAGKLLQLVPWQVPY